MIEITWDNELMQELSDFFSMYEPKSFFFTHYELAKLDGTPSDSPQIWKDFLTTPEVSDYINKELRLLQQAEMRKMLQDISKNAKSVGTAQNLTALLKVMDSDSGNKDGPAFIYTYVPLNSEEVHAPNVNQLDHDPFRREL